jgi:hypothetical protein
VNKLAPVLPEKFQTSLDLLRDHVKPLHMNAHKALFEIAALAAYGEQVCRIRIQKLIQSYIFFRFYFPAARLILRAERQ